MIAGLPARGSRIALAIVVLGVVFGSGTGTASEAGTDGDLVLLADDLLRLGAPYDAITEYERHLSVGPPGDRTAEVRFRLGRAYQAMDEWAKSIGAFEASLEAGSDPRHVDSCRLAIATSSLAEGDQGRAYGELDALILSSADARAVSRARLLRSVASTYDGAWADARRSLADLGTRPTDPSFPAVARADRRLTEGGTRGHKSPGFAKFLSTFVPGAGQLYAGRPRSALNAFLLNAVTVGIVTGLATDGESLEAGLFVAFFGIRYYNGNRHHAARLAREADERYEAEHRDRALEALRELAAAY